jgi:hypothetical protein
MFLVIAGSIAVELKLDGSRYGMLDPTDDLLWRGADNICTDKRRPTDEQ